LIGATKVICSGGSAVVRRLGSAGMLKKCHCEERFVVRLRRAENGNQRHFFNKLLED